MMRSSGILSASYEALAAKAREADEDIGTARLVDRARKEIAAGTPLRGRIATSPLLVILNRTFMALSCQL